ncbi:hypothetical protein D3C78_1977340 [compost metagenome]
MILWSSYQGSAVKRTIEGMIEVGEPLIREAIEALRTYHNAQAAGVPVEEIERLRLSLKFVA